MFMSIVYLVNSAVCFWSCAVKVRLKCRGSSYSLCYSVISNSIALWFQTPAFKCDCIQTIYLQKKLYILLVFLGAFAKLRKVTISFIMPGLLFVCMEQLCSHWIDFYEIWYLRIFWKSVERIQVWLKSDKNNGQFTWRPMYSYDNIVLTSSQNKKCFRQKF